MTQNASKKPSSPPSSVLLKVRTPRRCMITGTTITAELHLRHLRTITISSMIGGTTPRSAQLNHFRDFLHDLWHETPRSAQLNHFRDFLHDLWHETPRSAQLNHFRDFLHDLWHETPQTTTCTSGTSTTCRETRKLVSA